ncbi:sulfate reduction electron transfer complex DsrMKJOP subunit DsrK [Telmatospirillum sp. J64-1]|uniref:sulfate reduction electron transfer complex DsrMKJOP subunit DsrK n=1 Tax=Telmatospirillum sp. J64-1 TaxID=2502183 RepID=UPI00115EE434|nr:(Fe-S)-binding protein [Telmatospirillum sp. J64-1]
MTEEKTARPHRARPESLEALGFPGELPEDWQQRAVAALGRRVRKQPDLRFFLNACVKCGACNDACHAFLGTGDPGNRPVARQDLLRAVHRRHFTLAGRLFPKLVGALDLDEAMLERWYSYFHQCSECRRCATFCPFGIDTAEITMAARSILAEIGLGQKSVAEVIAKVHRTGNNLGLNPRALRHTLDSLEEDVREETGMDIRFPLDEAGADILLVTPSADFYSEPHVSGLIGYAKVLHAAGISWTLSSHASEAANFALFLGSDEHMRRIARRIQEAAEELGTSRLVFGECGHAWRVAYNFPALLGGDVPRPRHILDLTHELIGNGIIRLDPSRNAGMAVTLHDSCNVARGSGMGVHPGGQLDIPRAVLAAAVPRTVEMPAGTTGDRTFCCGGGGGLLTDEMMEIRIKGAAPRAAALRQAVEGSGATHMAAICAICKSQFSEVLPHHGFDRGMVVGIMQLVGRALVL